MSLPIKPNLHQDVNTLWKKAQADAKRTVAENRAAVLRYPDLAAKLTESPIGYADAKQWNGYVPPREFNGAINPDGRRTALFDLVVEALTRAENDGRLPQAKAS